ncbi:MAG: GumC family protein, partial [Paracoccaceae bacterium]
FRISQQSVFQQRLTTVERDISSLTEQRRRLVDVFNATGRVVRGAAILTPEQQELTALQDDLRRALAVYSSENPRIKLIQAQIAQQEAAVTGQNTTNAANGQGPLTVLDINLADIDARNDLLENERQRVLIQLQDLKSSIDRTAEISIALNAFNRDYANIQRQYDLAIDRLSKAAAAERIELLSKGRRIAVLAPATAPQKPDRPNRLLIGVGGMLLSAAAGVALVVLLEFFNKSIRRAADIKLHLGITPLATVPYIRTPYELVLRRAGFIAVLTLLIVGVPAVLFAVHTYYMPLDLIYEKVAEKITANI